MKAAIVRKHGEINVEEAPIPEIQEGEALIKVKYNGICGSDLHVMAEEHKTAALPVIMGHEFVGELADFKSKETVDLKVGDLTRDAMQTLNSDLTAANFGKLDAQGSAADQAAGLINMILETIGVMAILAVRQDTTRTIVLTGALAVLPQAKPLYDRMSRIYNVNFLIPDHAPYAAALGAVLTIL